MHGLASDVDKTFDFTVLCAALLVETNYLFLLIHAQVEHALDALLVEQLVGPLHDGPDQVLPPCVRLDKAVHHLVEDLVFDRRVDKVCGRVVEAVAVAVLVVELQTPQHFCKLFRLTKTE